MGYDSTWSVSRRRRLSFAISKVEETSVFAFIRISLSIHLYHQQSFSRGIGSLLQTSEEDINSHFSLNSAFSFSRTTPTLFRDSNHLGQVENSSPSLARNFPLVLPPSFQLSFSLLHSSSPDSFPRPYTTQFSSATTPVYLLYLPALPFYHNVSSSLPTRNYPPHRFFRFRLSFQQPSIVSVTAEHYSTTLLSPPKYRSGGITEGSLG